LRFKRGAKLAQQNYHPTGRGNSNVTFFEVPDMDHCFNAGGDKGDPAWWIGSGAMAGAVGSFIYIPPDSPLVTPGYDALMALDRWVMEDKAPASLYATGFVSGTLAGSLTGGEIAVNETATVQIFPA
jgi:hypothetical protein